MTKNNLLRGFLLLMIAGSVLGLTACATCEGETCVTAESDSVVFGNTQDVYIDTLACNNEEECLIGKESDDFLTEQFIETYAVDVPVNSEIHKSSSALEEQEQKKKTETLVINDDSSLALSRPSVTRGVSVKDKQKAVLEQKPKTVTVKSVKTVRTVTPVEMSVIEEDAKADVKDTKVDIEGAVVEAPANEEKAVVDVSTDQEKKTTTTITETTTSQKIQQEGIVENGVVSDTLYGRVLYGQQIHDWEALPGDTLRMLLSNWGEKSGWTVVWKLDRDYHLEAGVVFRGNFTDVASAIIRSFARATPAPIGTFYKGNRVLVVSTQEDENER